MDAWTYAIGIGGNRPTRLGPPERTLAHALAALASLGRIAAVSRPVRSRPLGPSLRRYANAALLLETPLPPPALLAALKRIERAHGRRPGRRWSARPLDLDILLWSGGRVATRTLTIPHTGLATRAFVLDPLAAIAPGLRLPGTAVAVRHLRARLTRPRPLR